MSGEEKVVCVTEAAGYIASWLLKKLLQRGYTINATVRDPYDPKTEHLCALDGAKERLGLFKANLLEKGSFDSAVEGCRGVFHTACPSSISPNDPQVELIDPVVKGTLNLLRSCSKFHSIKRVVLTSSMSSIFSNGTHLTPDLVVDETWFSNPDLCKELKTLAEEAAWNFAKENGIDLVTINPGLVLGPFLKSNLNFSVEVIQKLIYGARIYPSPYCVVDVRDVAYAHIQALEIPTANGKYATVERVTHDYEILKILRKNYPSLHLPEKLEDDKYEPTYQISKERAKIWY